MRNSRKAVSDGKLNIISHKVKYYRTKNNLTFQKLSDELMLLGIDIQLQSLYRIEIGTRTVVDYELCAFAKIFNVTVNDLVSDYYENLK